ncbi:tRNA-uridine aminocarboxypropyltransferase [Oceanisphaera sp. W20_SRM_FM3]|uniref:tRNA-uridine aminocarboxypropyltransferase n=1 Tax=Oceanisphaera sp. W20_SRM_FM3 TaxID=3240267 RepID=UPI003F990652
MSRVYCCACQLPHATCLCAHVHPQPCPMPIIIYQHPLEAKHAKSTVPLLRLGLPNIGIEVGEQLTPPTALKAGDWWLLYPDANAVDLDKLCSKQLRAIFSENTQSKSVQEKNLQAKKQIGGLIVLDGTWRKTRLLLHLNPWLMDLPKLTFSQAPKSGYAIRKGPGGQALSTLESVSHVLNRLCPEFLTAPLHALLAARVRQFQVQSTPATSTDTTKN